MWSHALSLAIAATGQYPVSAPLPPPVPVPDYAIAVRENYPKPLPDGPIIVSYYRPLAVNHDKQTVDDAARRILQIGFLTSVKEERQADQLAIPRMRPRALNRRGGDSREARAARRQIEQTITDHWQVFEARVVEVRFFVHQPDEMKLAIHRAGEAWSVVRSLLAQHPDAMSPLMADNIARIEEAVATLQQQAAL